MKITISGGGGPTFTVANEKRDDLVVSSALTGYDAVRAVADWLAVVPSPSVTHDESATATTEVRKSKTLPPKEIA